MNDNKIKKSDERLSAQKKYAGAATDRADGNKVDRREVEQETRMLNNNPRNTDL